MLWGLIVLYITTVIATAGWINQSQKARQYKAEAEFWARYYEDSCNH